MAGLRASGLLGPTASPKSLAEIGPVARAWLNAWGLLLLIGVIGLGMVLPLALYWRGGKGGVHDMTTTAALVLVGGFILRLVIVFSAQGI